MTDDPAQFNPRPFVLDGLPTPYLLRRIVGDERGELSIAILTLADRLPTLLAAEEEARRWRRIVAQTEPMTYGTGERCPFCLAVGDVGDLSWHGAGCEYVEARSTP